MQLKSMAFLAMLCLSLHALDNGVAQLPPLALSTGSLGCNIDEVIVKGQIEQLLLSGLAKIGYKYLFIQDCWQGQRDSSTGRIQEDINRFPSGLKELVSYAHSKGISMGIGTDINNVTALGRPGSLGYEKLDAQTYAAWGIDWVSISNSQNIQSSRTRFTLMSQFLLETSRKMMISIDNRGKENVEYWGASVANFWTTSANRVGNFASLQDVLVDQQGLEAFATAGAWNYPSPISSILNSSEYIAQLATWFALKSPILLGAPLQQLDSAKMMYLLNEQLLAISQDDLKKQAKLLKHLQFSSGWQSTWGGPLSKSRYVVIFINGLSSPSAMNISLSGDAGLKGVESYWIRDPIARTTLGSSSSDNFRVERVAAHGVQVRILHL